jgi:membrane-associated phospholipid phosphatase
VLTSRTRARRWDPAVAGLGAVVIAALTSGRRGRKLDNRLFVALNGTGGPFADAFFKAITELGSLWASVGAAAVLARRDRNRRAALDALGAALAMWAVGQALKKRYRRSRPYRALDDVRLMIAEPQGTSWPSSHPAVLFTFLLVCLRDLDAPGAVRAGATALAGAVGLSRVYLGVHYPADVLGGLVLGRGMADLWSASVSPRLLGGPAGTGVQ